MVLPLAAVGVGNNHPIIRRGRRYDDFFMVDIHYGGSDLSYEQKDTVVCHTEPV